MPKIAAGAPTEITAYDDDSIAKLAAILPPGTAEAASRLEHASVRRALVVAGDLATPAGLLEVAT